MSGKKLPKAEPSSKEDKLTLMKPDFFKQYQTDKSNKSDLITVSNDNLKVIEKNKLLHQIQNGYSTLSKFLVNKFQKDFNKVACVFYLPIAWIPQIVAIVSLILLRKDFFVRFHAIQSLMLSTFSIFILFVLSKIVELLDIYISVKLLLLILPLLALVYFHVYQAWQAYYYKKNKIVFLGNITEFLCHLIK